MKTLNMCGNPCPVPVVNAKKALAEKDAAGVVVLVDNIVAVQNLEKMAKGTGCGFSYEETGASEYKVTITKGANSAQFFTEPADGLPGGSAGTGSGSGGSTAGGTSAGGTSAGGTSAGGTSAGGTSAGGSVARGPVVLVTSDSMGRGAEDLGRLLIKGFIFSLTQLNPPPEAVIFLNGGARLTTEGANTVPDLKTLETKGVSICTCGTCANYYKLTESLAVGSIVDMMNITTRLSQAALVITL